MGGSQAIFKRVEKKYLLSKSQYEQLMYYIGERLCQDKFGVSTIYNIYFDTPDFLLIRRSLDKPVYKEKLRFRTYCVPKCDSESFIELKKKYKGVVYKRRVEMNYAEAVNYLYYGKQAPRQSQITNEIDWTLQFYKDLQPAMFIFYDRLAYYDYNNPDLRITFDTNITWRRDNLFLSEGAWGNKLLSDDLYLMEIKIPGAMPLWLSRILDMLNIFPVSFSKYGRAYMEDLKSQREEKIQGGIICA